MTARRALMPAMCLLAALPVIVSTVHALAVGWTPVGDDAVIGLRAYDVLTAHSPLVGQYSASSALTDTPTYSPGPLLYWLLAIPARIGGAAMLLTIGLVNMAAAAGTVPLARRRGGTWLMVVTAIAVALMQCSLDQRTLSDLWNPAAALLPFTLLIFLTLSLACGEMTLLPLTVLVASYVLQCHLAYLVPVIGLLAVAATGLAVTRPRRWLLSGLAVALVCWSAPLIDQVKHEPGNLHAIAKAATSRGRTIGFSLGWHEAAGAFGAPPYWTRPTRPLRHRVPDPARPPGALTIATFALIVAALGALFALALRHRRRDLAAATGQALILCAALVAVAAAIPLGALLVTAPYTLWWESPAGMWAWLAAGWAAVELMPLPRVAPRVRVALAAAGAAASVVAVVHATPGPDILAPRYGPARSLASVSSNAIRGHAPALVQTRGPFSFAKFDFQTSLAYALRRRGVRVVAPSLVQPLGSSYGATGVTVTRAVDVGDAHVGAPPGSRLLMRTTAPATNPLERVRRPPDIVVTLSGR